ncbi:ligase-associated DNA damage response endonuclease PdeM [Pedobacter gandavensis]|uniref:Ligase-associated DNA damage response endonuclease PdeM n=1 Tax=Pedobacter gandavensis TaxID=2679963 RepID=A0ABR6EU76_9SPHI|nr:ligase-associated DNA damage response endonuclease PdeM [Pedobacter gandavensis]MBB2148747.1 ligase-associated DNA damage response endonuclease PdeM [Pedobacter gandavensis]
MTITCSGETLILNIERAIFWPNQQLLIISDLHIGKAAHFRKHGIQVPSTLGDQDLQRLAGLIELYKPSTVLITGDLFHDQLNSDVDLFSAWKSSFSATRFLLIKGNHDKLIDKDYKDLGIEVYEEEMIFPPFRFIHDRPDAASEYYTISGHIHPGLRIYGKARQSLNLPCFYFGASYAVLPAFSAFTGLSMIKPQPGDRFYAITPNRIIAV